MGKYIIILITLFMILLSGNTALAGQHTHGFAEATTGIAASGILSPGSEAPVLLAAGKEWNEDQQNVVRSFQEDRNNSLNSSTLHFIYSVIAIIVLVLLVSYLWKLF